MIRPTVRLAENSEGEAVRSLLAESGPVEEHLAFDKINPYWLVAELPERGIVGCIQTCPSRPIGRLEMLAVSKSLMESERGLVVRQLVIDGAAVLHYHGATHVAGFVPFALKSYKRVLEKRGSIVADSGNLMLRRIA